MTKAAWVAATIAALLVVGAAVIVTRGAPPGESAADQVVDSWIAAMAEPSGDRGWSWLSMETQALIYGGDAGQYWGDLEEVDWSDVAWAPARGHVDDGAFYLGDVWLRSHPSTLPRFLFERGLAAATCVDDAPFGIHVQMRLGWFNPPRISGLIGKAGVADPCVAAFDDEPGAPHEPFDLIGGAWATPGSIQRVGVIDSSGAVTSVGWGRDNPPLDGQVAVSLFEPRNLAVTWRGAACDSNTTLIVSGSASALEIAVRRGSDEGCSGTEVIYESILELRLDVPIERVHAEMAAGQ